AGDAGHAPPSTSPWGRRRTRSCTDRRMPPSRGRGPSPGVCCGTASRSTSTARPRGGRRARSSTNYWKPCGRDCDMAVSTSETLEIDPRLLERLKGIELKSRFLVRGLYVSRHRTADHGSSTEFIEHRDYRRGDELRRIDWRVLARTDRLSVKVHEMESTMKVHLVVDTSESMRVPPPAGLPGKLDLACLI